MPLLRSWIDSGCCVYKRYAPPELICEHVSNKMTQLEAFILIGGRSSRLGTEKAFVALGGMTLTERAVDVVQHGLAPERMTIVAGNAAQFPIQAIVADVPFIFDVYENRGPLGGLHAALAYARTPWIFVLACDYPFVSPELLSFLAQRRSDEFGAILPEQEDGRLQPLCAFYKVETARPVVEEILERPRVSPPMHEVAMLLSPLVVKFDEYSHLPEASGLFLNINTADELERARRRV